MKLSIIELINGFAVMLEDTCLNQPYIWVFPNFKEAQKFMIKKMDDKAREFPDE